MTRIDHDNTTRLSRTSVAGRGAVIGAFLAMALQACGGGDAAVDEAPELGAVVVTQWGDATELFLEYPFLIAGEQTGNWAIHLTDLEDFQPVRSGTLTVSFQSAGTGAESFTLEAPARDGIFLLDPIIARPGSYDVELSLASEQVVSRHVMSNVLVHPDRATALAHALEEEVAGISFLKEQQWTIPFAVEAADARVVAQTATAPGEIISADGSRATVSAPTAGIVPVAANRSAPSVGDRISRGQVLAVLAPTGDDDGFAQKVGRVERLRREVERDGRLFEAGAIPARRLEEARHDLEIAEAELAAIGGEVDGTYQLLIRSPIDGVVGERSFAPGGRVDAGAPLFTIVNPDMPWLRVQLPASVARGVPPGAVALFSTDSGETFEARLRSIASILDDRTRTVAATFVVAPGQGTFRFGQYVLAHVPTGTSTSGIAIPNSAILDENGTRIAYVQAGGETFLRRALTTGETDGRFTRVLSGINPGDMVVIVGAYQVRLASLSGGDFAGGHAH